MMRRVAQAAELPVATDAPTDDGPAIPEVVVEGANPVQYDATLQQDLIDLGPDTLRQYGVIVVRDVHDPARYNAAVWYALAHDLAYRLDPSYEGGAVIITDPTITNKGA